MNSAVSPVVDRLRLQYVAMIVALAVWGMLGGCSLMVDTESCSSDEDCGGAQVCTGGGLCTEVTALSCQRLTDCPAGYRCAFEAGRCEVDNLSCESDGDCPTDYECSEMRLCELGERSCDDSDDCPEGFGCNEDLDICTDTSAQCQVDSDCQELLGEDATCEDGICQGETDLLGGPCQQIHGATEADDPIILGSILQLSGVGGGFGQPMLDAKLIALSDFNSGGGVDGRPLALVACDTEGSDDIAEEAAEHLIDVGAEAILGMNSSQVLGIGPSVTVPNEVLLMSPSATAVTIPPQGHEGLIWRTAPSDEAQGQALVQLVTHLAEERLPEETEVDDPKVAVLVRSQDQWSEGLRDALLDGLPGSLTGSDSDRFTLRTFPNVGAGDEPDYAPVAADLAGEEREPDIVVVLGSADAWQVMRFVDDALDNEPLFVGGDAMKNLEEAAEAPSSLEGRIYGTGPRNVAETAHTPYTIFRLRFEEEMNDNADNYQFVANAFDAVYTVVFGAMAGGATGPGIAEGLTMLSDGPDIQPRSDDRQQAASLLADGESINYSGASGPINFDENGNPEPMPIALWCLEDGQVPEIGALYEPDTDTFNPLRCDE